MIYAPNQIKVRFKEFVDATRASQIAKDYNCRIQSWYEPLHMATFLTEDGKETEVFEILYQHSEVKQVERAVYLTPTN